MQTVACLEVGLILLSTMRKVLAVYFNGKRGPIVFPRHAKAVLSSAGLVWLMGILKPIAAVMLTCTVTPALPWDKALLGYVGQAMGL